MRVRVRAMVGVVSVLLVAGCAGADEAPAESDEQTTVDEQSESEQEPEPEPTPEPEPEPEPEQEPEPEPTPEPEPEAVGPTAYSSLYSTLEPSLDTAEGEVTVTLGPPGSGSIPFLVHNGTDELISRVEVSGMVVDGAGGVIGSGGSQSVRPNAVPPGEVTIGYVYAGMVDLPADSRVEDLAVDYEVGLGQFENIVSVDVTEVVETDAGLTGRLSNPHDIDLDGPVGVMVACMDSSGQLVGYTQTFADRDSLEAGGTSTFSVRLGSSTPSCEFMLVAASGFQPF